MVCRLSKAMHAITEVLKDGLGALLQWLDLAVEVSLFYRCTHDRGGPIDKIWPTLPQSGPSATSSTEGARVAAPAHCRRRDTASTVARATSSKGAPSTGTGGAEVPQLVAATAAHILPRPRVAPRPAMLMGAPGRRLPRRRRRCGW